MVTEHRTLKRKTETVPSFDIRRIWKTEVTYKGDIRIRMAETEDGGDI